MRRAYFLTAISLLAALVTATAPAYAQRPEDYRFRGGRYTGFEILDGDTVITVQINPLYVYTPPRNMKQYQRLVRNVKKVYPYAMEARRYMRQLDTKLDSIKSPIKRERFVASMEREIVRKYTPILERMTFTQGKILIKLIDRETARTPYQILRQFRGRLTAGFYNTIAKLFKADLHQHYDPAHNEEDAQIERIVTLIEAGLL